ncbi:MAG: Holliday junction resolvase RuvX [Firmicutes bacterium]|nr:Holliday junction resolvase RuvX [Bacillota bacterium]MBQ2041812.1 Holliday junction resolvase RuvX [Bacillota bacterium]
MRWMGLDIGDKTIGVAVSDPLFISAQGVTTVERIGIKKDTSKLIEMIKEYEVDTVVSGLPLMLDGSDSPQTEKVREFVTRLENKARSSGLKLSFVFQDERFTTKIAENVLIEANMRREKRKTIIDRQAAVIILQSYMDANRRS